MAVDQATGHAEITARAATLAVAGPVALYLLSVWALHVRDKPRGLSRVAAPCTAGLVVVAGVLAWPVPVIGLLLAVLIAVSEVAPRRPLSPRPIQAQAQTVPSGGTVRSIR